MAYGDLFRHFTVRFSMKKREHVRLLEKFEDNERNGGKTKNQVVMDALKMYYDAQEREAGEEFQKEMTPAYFEKRLSGMKEEIKAEVIQEVVRIVLGNALAGQPVMAHLPGGKPGLGGTEEDMEEDGTAGIIGMPDVMDKIMGWSED